MRSNAVSGAAGHRVWKSVGACTHQAIKYYSVGAAALLIDVTLFQGLIAVRVMPVIAAALSYGILAPIHFLTNRLWTFRAFQRTPLVQARTYVIVSSAAWLITVLVVTLGTRVAEASPLAAKVAAVIVTAPFGFLGHRYCTYGLGIRVGLRRVVFGVRRPY
jgi:putative flippase GtrA